MSEIDQNGYKMENSKVKIPKAYFDSRIECRIANPAMFQAAMQLPLNRIKESSLEQSFEFYQKLLKR